VPTYQYACTSCGEQLEAVQRFSDDPLTVCPACGSALRKVYSPVGIVFKGSGFYRTDSRKSTIPSGEKNGPDKSGPDKSGTDKSGDKDKVTTKANGSGDGSSSSTKTSSDSSSSNGTKSADKKPAKTAST
jgi:putative FmdB family regulatory protein